MIGEGKKTVKSVGGRSVVQPTKDIIVDTEKRTVSFNCKTILNEKIDNPTYLKYCLLLQNWMDDIAYDSKFVQLWTFEFRFYGYQYDIFCDIRSSAIRGMCVLSHIHGYQNRRFKNCRYPTGSISGVGLWPIEGALANRGWFR